MPTILDTLVRLASLGAAGISIFAIFWIGWLILRIPSGQDPQRHRTLRMFMLTCVAIAMISGGTGFVNARSNADAIDQLQAQNRMYENSLAKAGGVLDTLRGVLKSKELAAAESGSAEIRRQVDQIKNAVSNLESITQDIKTR